MLINRTIVNNNHMCAIAADISTNLEKCNTDLKIKYLVKNITIFNETVKNIFGNKGSFGTGYPFYALQKGFKGPLPIIEEQIRYNNELKDEVYKSRQLFWPCYDCLKKNQDIFPDLKQVCKPCPNVNDNLKPRKMLNRLPDLDMWMVCEGNYIESAKEQLIELLSKQNMYPSDIDPIKTITDLFEISVSLKNGVMPTNNLPLDIHIIDYDTLYTLIKNTPDELLTYNKDKVPYIPIMPISYRKKWQYDDTSYNFIHDYLSSFTEFNFDGKMQYILNSTRAKIADEFYVSDLYDILLATGPESVKRRHKTYQLKDRFYERVESWKKQK